MSMANRNEALVSVVIPCMGRAEHVLANLEHLAGTRAEIIVVDYSCPEGVGERARACNPDVVVSTVPDRQYFDPSEARNVGFEAATRPWVLFLDADILMNLPLFQDIALPPNKKSYFLLGKHRERGAFGSVLVSVSAVQKIGGYDVRFKGYGGEDIDFFERLSIAGYDRVFLVNEPVNILPHSVESRTVNFQEKDRRFSLLVNRAYGVIKADLLRNRNGAALGGDDLDRLRVVCERQMSQAFRDKKSTLEMRVDLRSGRGGYFAEGSSVGKAEENSVNRHLSYTFKL